MERKTFTHRGGCNVHCRDTIHGVLMLSDPDDTIEGVKEYIESEGLMFLAAEHAREADTEALKAETQAIHTLTDGGKETRLVDGWPDNQPAVAWLVIVQIPEDSQEENVHG